MIPMAAITGGWGYVIAGYVITWAMLGGYTLFLVLRSPSRTGSGDREEDR